MEAMKINIPVQRKTSIESNRNPESKDQNSKVEILWAVWPLVLAVGPVVEALGGLTATPGGWTGEEQRRNTVLKTVPWTRPKIDLTFDSQGKTSRNLNHTFLGLLGTYSNRRLQQLKPGFLSISDWSKKGQKLGQNENLI